MSVYSLALLMLVEIKSLMLRIKLLLWRGHLTQCDLCITATMGTKYPWSVPLNVLYCGFHKPMFLDNTVTHLVYIYDTNGKQGFCYWNQNKTNGQAQILTYSDT